MSSENSGAVHLPLPRHRRHRRRDCIGDLVFHREEVFDIAVEHLCPLHHVVLTRQPIR